MLRILVAAVLVAAASSCWADTAWPNRQQGNVVLADFRFASGEVLPALKIHYLTLGTARRDAAGEMYPDFMDALVPIASQPIAISGRNWMYRRIGIEAIRNDPDWNGGNYEKNPTHYIYSAPIAALMTESATHYQKVAPSRAAMDALYQKMVAGARKLDANNQLYAIEAVMDYDPSPDLEKIKARLLAINFAD